MARSPNGGPPFYDVSKKGNMKDRLNEQAKTGSPSPMYSSNWQEFRRTVLQNNSYIDRELWTIAMRAKFALKRRIPLGENEKDGRLRSAVTVQKIRKGGMYKDRDVYHIHAGGTTSADRSKWNAANFRSTFPDAKAWKARRLGEPGPLPSWLQQAERDIT